METPTAFPRTAHMLKHDQRVSVMRFARKALSSAAFALLVPPNPINSIKANENTRRAAFIYAATPRSSSLGVHAPLPHASTSHTHTRPLLAVRVPPAADADPLPRSTPETDAQDGARGEHAWGERPHGTYVPWDADAYAWGWRTHACARTDEQWWRRPATLETRSRGALRTRTHIIGCACRLPHLYPPLIHPHPHPRNTPHTNPHRRPKKSCTPVQYDRGTPVHGVSYAVFPPVPLSSLAPLSSSSAPPPLTSSSADTRPGYGARRAGVGRAGTGPPVGYSTDEPYNGAPSSHVLAPSSSHVKFDPAAVGHDRAPRLPRRGRLQKKPG
ncbi:hypothetical protein C8R44DRAFT_871636 [Mycena epipterygia]|nr:hypothetical protein C8R44DRAFT_871636 [Mycena epipterygia]